MNCVTQLLVTACTYVHTYGSLFQAVLFEGPLGSWRRGGRRVLQWKEGEGANICRCQQQLSNTLRKPQDYHMTITWPLHGHHKTITWPSHGHHMIITWPSHDHYMAITRQSHDHHMTITWPSHDNHWQLYSCHRFHGLQDHHLHHMANLRASSPTFFCAQW